VPKQKTNPKKLADHLKDFDRLSLSGAVRSLEDSLGWKVFASYVEHVAAFYAGQALAMAQHSGATAETASAAAKAEVLREVMETFLPDLQKKVRGESGIVENPPPQD